jgi:hypothetical protein
VSNVDRIRPDITQIEIPAQLRGLKGWLVWRYEQRPGEAKPRKVPHYVGGGRRGAHGTQDDRNRLTTADAAVAYAARKGFDGIGLAMLADWGMIALDFDNAASGGRVLAEVADLVSYTYAEFSPSGKGVRAFVMGVCPNKKNFDPPYGFETFCSSGFVTFTGNRLPSCEELGTQDTIAPISEAIRQLISDRLLKGRDPAERPAQSGERVGYSDEQLAAMLSGIDPDEHGYDRWYQIGMAIHHETDGDGFDIWDEWSSQGGQYPGRDHLQRKWDSFGRGGQQPVTIRTLIKWAGEAGSSVGGPVASVDDFEVLEDSPEEAAERKAKADRFQIYPADAFSNRPPPTYYIPGLWPHADLLVVYGDSGSGKSFVVTDMALSIARGVHWRDLQARQGRVVYIVAEGSGGYSQRLKAYGIHHQVSLAGIPFFVMPAAPNLLVSDDIKGVVQAIKAIGGADIVIFDTLAQVTPGANENSAEDMGLAIANSRAIARAVGGMAVLIHHSGKDATKGARGWSGLRAAADAQLEVVRLENGSRLIQTTKQKDGKDDGRWGFSLEDVVVGFNEEGEGVTSCVVVEAAVQAPGRANKAERVGVWERTVMETFAELQVGGDVLLTELVLRAAEKRPDAGNPRDRKKNAMRAVRNLSKGSKAAFILGDDYVTEAQ